MNRTSIPETPATVELCALMRHPDTAVFEGEAGIVLDNATLELIGLWRTPPTEVVRARIAAAPPGRTVVANTPDAAPDLAWRRARVFTLDDDTACQRVLKEARNRVRPMVASDFLAIDDVNLRAELAHAFGRLGKSRIYCALENNRPVAFAYAPCRSRGVGVDGGYFDLCVDTAPGFRRHGHASRATALCLQCEHRGARAVWSTTEDNVASMATARALGFVEDTTAALWVFETGF